MTKLFERSVSKLALAVAIGALSLSLSACAQHNVVDGNDNDNAAPAQQQASNGSSRVEKRIQTLHDKLQITPDQEGKFADVADVIRSNEESIHDLAEARHANENATAVEDLESYKQIADAHVDGLSRLIPAFQKLYKVLSDEQKANADKLFSKYEGHDGAAHHHKHHKQKAAQ